MIIDPHTYAEGFIQEDEVKKSARARGEEIGATDTTCGTGAYLKHLAHILSAQSVVERDFVHAAAALGESRFRILFFEVLPNVTGPLLVEANLRFTYSIATIASLAFLGFAPDPTAANWGTMIQENSAVIVVQPWGAMLPVIAIALLTIGTGLFGDGLSRVSAGIDRTGKGD